MGIYSPKAIFEKEPVIVAGALRSVLFVAVLLSLLTLSVEQLAAIALALELVLGLFARGKSMPTSKVSTGSGEG